MTVRDPRYPRPQLRREPWSLLDGAWDFQPDADATITHPRDVRFTHVIAVPFAPETEASGVGFVGFLRRCWYRRHVDIDPGGLDRGNVLVHFGAVDREAYVWADGQLVGRHTGGYTPFSVDVTDVARLADAGRIELVVRPDDQPRSLTIPRGKQDWWPEPHESGTREQPASGSRCGSSTSRLAHARTHDVFGVGQPEEHELPAAAGLISPDGHRAHPGRPDREE